MEGFVDKNNSNIIYGTTQFGGLNKTTNGGLSRFGLNVPVGDGNWNWIVPFEQDPALQNHIYTAYSQVFKSIDGGGNWFPISQDFGANIDHFKIAPTNSNRMYLAIDGNLWYTLNAGGSWFQSGLNLGGGWINEIAVHPSDPNKIAIATTDSNKVYLSTNGGASFTPIGWDLPNFSALSLAWQNNGNEGLYVGMNYGVYYTDTVLGNTWIPFNNGLPNVRINELEVNYADGKLYAATYGRGLWRSNLYNTTLNVSDFTLDTFRLFPNPASDNVTLKFSKADPVSVRVYNALGKLIFYDKEVSLSNGFDINVSSYTSGVYFVKLTGAQGEITKKLIIQ